MPLAARVWLFLGALNGLVAVAAGAYGRHGGLEPFGREMFDIAAQYQMAHGLAMLAAAWLACSAGRSGWRRAANVAGTAFALGILLFSGSLYFVALMGVVPMAGAAPAGGYLMMAGWLALMWTAIRSGLSGRRSSSAER